MQKILKVAVLRFPGTNCEFDTQYAFEKLGHATELVWHEDETLPTDIDLVVVPGGFSYGDYREPKTKRQREDLCTA